MEVSIRQSIPNYELRHAILLYGSGSGSTDLVTMHDVALTKAGPTIKEGRPATKDALLQMFEGVEQHVTRPLQLLHPDVLAADSRCLVWWVPAQSRRISFSCKELGKRAGVVPHPALMFAIINHKWFVFALDKNQRPSADAVISVAPYFNVWAAGNICAGSTALPKGNQASNPDAWTKAFFKSAFTHPNVQTKNGLVKYPTGVFAFWRDMLDGKFEEFPSEYLVGTKRTLKSMLAQWGKESVNA